jgi:predicted metal-dependent phosphoesterase TrpH
VGLNMRYADLHSHTTASDGTNSPSINVQLAKKAGLAVMAITDHDTVAGVEEALGEGVRLGIRVVPGVEISTVADNQDIHILGYFIDFHDSIFLERLQQLRDVRDNRNRMVMEKLSEVLQVHLTMDDVMNNLKKSVGPDETIGRPHIADLLMTRGYVSTLKEAFDLYLGKTGSAYINPPRIRPEQAIDWIHEAGGVSVIAHPGIYNNDPLVENLLQYGADGIEAYHADHSQADVVKYVQFASRYGLTVTAGSDYHGERAGVVFHAPIGTCRIDAAVVDTLWEKSNQYRRGGRPTI